MTCIAALGAMAPGHADPQAGAELFLKQCSQCHRGGAAGLRTPADAIVELLRSGSVRIHRFHLTDTQLRDLDAYMTEVKAHGR